MCIFFNANKVKWLRRKYDDDTMVRESGSREGRDLYSLVGVKDDQVEAWQEDNLDDQGPTSNFVVVGSGVTISKDEAAFLSLPPSFRLAVPVDKIFVEREDQSTTTRQGSWTWGSSG